MEPAMDEQFSAPICGFGGPYQVHQGGNNGFDAQFETTCSRVCTRTGIRWPCVMNSPSSQTEKNYGHFVEVSIFCSRCAPLPQGSAADDPWREGIHSD